MRNDQDVVFGDGEIQFQDIGAGLDAVVKAGQRVFGPVGAPTAVGVNEDRAGRRGGARCSRLGGALGGSLCSEGRGGHQNQCGEKRAHRVQGGGVALKRYEQKKAGESEQEVARTQVELALVARFKQLTEHTLPSRAKAERWPVRFDHCFKRICLDWAFGDVWYQHLARPAERHLRGAELERAVLCAEALLDGGLPVLQERDAASLRWRGKRPKAEHCAS